MSEDLIDAPSANEMEVRLYLSHACSTHLALLPLQVVPLVQEAPFIDIESFLVVSMALFHAFSWGGREDEWPLWTRTKEDGWRKCKLHRFQF